MAQSNIPTPKSQPQILGDMLNRITSKLGIRRLKVGNPILSILEAVSLTTAKATGDLFRVLQSKDLDNASGLALQRIGLDEKLPQLGPVAATAWVTITDTNFVKIASHVYHGSPAPIAGSASVNVDKAATFAQAPNSGSVYIGRGTPQSEGPIPYTSKVDNGNYYTLTLSTPTGTMHNQGEEVVLAQGGDRQINVGQTVSTKTSALSTPVQFSVVVAGVIPDGEVELTNIQAVCTASGSQGNVPENTITDFGGNPPFSGAAVTNPNRVTSGRDTETTQQYRDRIKAIRNARTKGTDLALKNAVLNVTAPDEQKTVLSSSIVRRLNKPSILYIDDGNGYEPISQGVGYEVLRDNASGGETDFQSIYSPIVLASVETLETAPFNISNGSTLIVTVGGNTGITHTFDTSVFNEPNAASAYDIASSINSNANLQFSARVSSNAQKVTIYPKDDFINNIQVTGGTANDILQFPTTEIATTLLYQNDRLLGDAQYYFDRANGSFQLVSPLSQGDRLSLGSLWTRGFVESATPVVSFSLTNDQKLWFVLDGNTSIIDSAYGGVSILTTSVVAATPSCLHIAVTNNFNFSPNVKPGHSILLYTTANNQLPSALEGVWKIVDVPSANTVVIEYPQMQAARKLAASAVLANNKVLICGGLCSYNTGILNSVDIYDASTGVFTKAAPMLYPRYAHTATTLPSGKVLVVGGVTSNGASWDHSEIYDPVANTWTAGPTSFPSVAYHAATLLNTGKVLIAGGLIGSCPTWTVSNTSFEYDPVGNTFGSSTTFSIERYLPSLTTLPDGSILMVGGLALPPNLFIEDSDSTANSNAKFCGALNTYKYSPGAHTWSNTATITEAATPSTSAYRNYTTALVDSNTVVAVADNWYYTYSISGNAWTSQGAIAQTPNFASNEKIFNGTSYTNDPIGGIAYSSFGRTNPLIKTGSGKVIMAFAEYTNIATGSNSHLHLVYNTGTAKWDKTGVNNNKTFAGPRSHYTAVASPYSNDEVLVFGGQDGNANSADVYAVDKKIKPIQATQAESLLSATVETINTSSNAVNYKAPILGAYQGVQGWVIYSSTAGSTRINVPAATYTAASLSEAIVANGLNAQVYKNTILRVSTNDTTGDIILLGPTVGNIEKEVARGSNTSLGATNKSSTTEIDIPYNFRFYQAGGVGSGDITVASQLSSSNYYDPDRLNDTPFVGTICGLLRKNYLEASPLSTMKQLAEWPNSVQPSVSKAWGNLKQELAQIGAVTVTGQVTTNSPGNAVLDSTLLGINNTVTITPNQPFYCGTPYKFTPTDKLNVTVDGDSFAGAFVVPMARKVKPTTNNYSTLITVNDAENGNATLATKFGLGYTFDNFYVSMAARNKLGDILFRFYRPGAEGENYIVRYEYPTAPNMPLSVSVNHNWQYWASTQTLGHTQKSYIDVTLPSSTPYTTAVMNATSKILVTEQNFNSTTRLGDLHIMVGMQVTQAERTTIGGTTRLQVQYPDASLTGLGVFQVGDFIRFDAVTSTPTTLQSGQTKIVAVGTPSGLLQDITIAAGSLDDGTSTYPLATNPGTISFDPVATEKIHFDTSISAGDIVSFKGPSTITNTLLGKGAYPVVSVGSTNQYLKCRSRDLDTGLYLFFAPIVDKNNLSVYKLASSTQSSIVTAVNALAAQTNSTCSVKATLLANGSTAITKASWDSGSVWDAGSALTDGYNVVLSTVDNNSLATNTSLNLKRPINADLASNADWVNEDVYLIPCHAKDVVKWLNTPCITGLWTRAFVETADNGMSVQITSKNLGRNSSIQVASIGANEALAPVVGQASIPALTGPSSYPSFVVTVNTPNAVGFTGDSFVKITNTIPNQKAYYNNDIPANLILNINPDGTVIFDSDVTNDPTSASHPWSCNFPYSQPLSSTGSIERAGKFTIIKINAIRGAAWANGTTNPGDYIYLNTPTYSMGSEPFTSLLPNISNANTGTFRIVNVTNGGSVIWIENEVAVTEKCVFDYGLISANSVVPGDTFTIISDSLGFKNKGSWKVLSVGMDPTNTSQFVSNSIKLDVSNKTLYAVETAAPMWNSTVQLAEGSGKTFYRKLLGINPNSSNGSLTDLVLSHNKQDNALGQLIDVNTISASSGSIVESLNKLQFPTDTKVGVDSYRYHSGLIGEVKRVIYGDPNDPQTYPGYVSNGASVLVDGPVIKSVKLGFAVRAIGNPNEDFADRIRSMIAASINSNPVGLNLDISNLITAGGSVDGVQSITCLYTAGDQIPVGANEKTMVLNLNDISIVWIE